MRAIILAAVALTACQQATAPAAKPSPTATGYIAKVQALPPAQRDGVLLRAILAGGGPGCQGVAKTQPQPPHNGQPIWIVTCTEGSQWLISLADDGTATVTGARNPNA
jgi:hypothetical protein